jgi:hypothetical protein
MEEQPFYKPSFVFFLLMMILLAITLLTTAQGQTTTKDSMWIETEFVSVAKHWKPEHRVVFRSQESAGK